MTGRPRSGIGAMALAFAADEGGSNAIEFSLLASPFIFMLVGVLQLGVYFMAQSALDSAVARTAESLRRSFNTSTVTTFPNAATLKSRVATYSGGMIQNNTNLAVEIRQLTSLTGAKVEIVDATNDYGSDASVLALRAKSSVLSFLPGFSSFKVSSTALVRRQGR